MNLLWFENLLLMRLWVWNTYLVLLWNRALAYPRALLHSGGPLSCKFWQLTIPLKVWSTYLHHLTSYYSWGVRSSQRMALREITVDTLVSTLTRRYRLVTLRRKKQGYLSVNPTQDQWGSNRGCMNDWRGVRRSIHCATSPSCCGYF